jgi:hypothetical protein
MAQHTLILFDEAEEAMAYQVCLGNLVWYNEGQTFAHTKQTGQAWILRKDRGLFIWVEMGAWTI